MQPRHLINVVSNGFSTSCSNDSPIFPPKAANGEETINIAVPRTVVTNITGLTKKASPVIASADGVSSTVLDQAVAGNAKTNAKVITKIKYERTKVKITLKISYQDDNEQTLGLFLEYVKDASQQRNLN